MKKFVRIKPGGDAGAPDGEQREVRMLDYERFRRVYKPVNPVTTFFGSGLGIASVLVGVMSPYPKLLSIFLVLASVGLGWVYAQRVRSRYMVLFPDGVPWPPTSETISPSYYGRVASRYFWRFQKSLTISFVLSLIVLIIYRIVT